MIAGILAGLLLLGSQDAAQLIEALRSGTIEEREKAIRRLREMGTPALPLLEAAAKEKDLELSARARYVIRTIELDGRISPGLRKAIPKIQDRLASGDPHQWTEVFLQLGLREKRLYPELTPSDLDPLVAGAVSAASAAELPQVVQTGLSWRLPSLAPEAARLLANETSPTLRLVCVRALSELDHRASAPLIAEMALEEKPLARQTAIRALRVLGPSSAMPVLRRALADKTPAVRTRALQALGHLEAGDAVGDVLPLLKDQNSQVRAMAATTLGQLRAVSSAADLSTLLKDSAGAARGEAALALSKLGDARRAADLAALLIDPDLSVREKAIRGLARLGSADLERKLQQLLTDTEPSIRRAAVSAVALLGAADRIPDVIKRLGDSDPEIRVDAVECLAALRADLTVLARLRDDPDESVRIQVALAQCGAGSRSDAQWLVERGYLPLSLNQFRKPAEWARLQEAAPEMSWEGTPREILERFAADCGWTVVWPEDLPRDDYWTVENLRAAGARPPKRRIDTLDRICQGSYVKGPYSVILEEGRLRVASDPVAFKFWTAWWSESRDQK